MRSRRRWRVLVGAMETEFNGYFARERGVLIFALHSVAGYPLIPQMKPEAAARTLAAAARASAPVALRSIWTQVRILRGTFSSRGRIAAVPKSMITPIRFLLASGLTRLQSCEKLGATRGAEASIDSLLKVWLHPSTEPSLMLVVGPVIAIVHVEAPG